MGAGGQGPGEAIEAIAARIFGAGGAGAAQEQPTAESVLASLAPHAVSAEDVEAKRACSVCMSDFAVGEKGVVALPCAHLFHFEECLKPWLSKAHTCPVRLSHKRARSRPRALPHARSCSRKALPASSTLPPAGLPTPAQDA